MHLQSDHTNSKILASWASWLLLFGIIGLNLFLKFFNIAEISLNLDEAYSIFFCQQSVASIFEMMEREANPPLYFLSLHYVIKLFGTSVEVTRGFSVILSALSAGVLFAYGKQFFNLGVGIISALLFTLSNAFILYAQEVRGFSLVVLWQLGVIWCFTSFIKSKHKSALWGLTVFNTLLLYTHYASFLAILAQLLVLGIFIRKWWDTKWQVFLSYSLAFILCIPNWLQLSGPKISSTSSWLNEPGLADFIRVAESLGGNRSAALLSFVIVIITLLLWLYKKPQKNNTTLLVYYTSASLGCLVLGWVISQWVPLFLTRYLLFSGVAWCILVAYCLSHPVWPKAGAVVLTVGLIATSAYYTTIPQPKGEDWKGAVALINQNDNTGVEIIVSPVFYRYPFAYYFQKTAFENYDNLFPVLYQDGCYFLDQITPKLFGHTSPTDIIYVERGNASTFSNSKNLKTLLLEGYDLQQEQAVRGIAIYTLSRSK